LAVIGKIYAYGIINIEYLIKNMRNKNNLKISWTAAVILPFLAFSVAFAQTGTNDSDSGTIRQKKVGQMMDGTAQDQTMMEQSRSQRVAMMKKLMQNQINRSEKALGRLEQIISRIESRREKLEGSGADLTAIDALIEQAKVQKQEADDALNKAKTDLENIDENNLELRKAVQTFMGSMRVLKKELIDLHRALKNIVKEMRRAVPKPDEESDETETTPTLTPTPTPTSN
jgi:chromosome segregation ATPase